MNKNSAAKRQKEIRETALNSAFAKIPKIPLQVAALLVEAGYSEIFQLRSRSAESLFAEIQTRDLGVVPEQILPALRLAIYFAENAENLDRKLLNLDAWK